MAQDILATHPAAVTTDDGGYYLVDYAMLGLCMMKLDDWRVNHSALLLESA